MNEEVDQRYEGAVLFDGLDAAIIGYGNQHGQLPVAVYSEKKILELLQDQGMDENEAQEFYGYNIQCLYAGLQTPVILSHEVELD